MVDKRVVNLSSRYLNADELSILSKGMKFCPTPGHPDPGELRDDLDKLHKRLRQVAFYEQPVDLTDSVISSNTDTNVKIDLGENLQS